MCEVNTALKARFCKDNNLSIQLFHEPYFMDRIELFGQLDKWNDFVKMLEQYNTAEDYFAEYNRVKDGAIGYIKESTAFQHLNQSQDAFERIFDSIPDRDAYKEMNIGRRFLSIDMSKANFSCLVVYAKRTGTKFYDTFDYESFIGMFTNNDHVKKSKYIRQVIFGNCNCKRMISFEKTLMHEALYQLVSNGIIPENELEKVYALRADEIIVDITELDNTIVENLLKYAFEFPTKKEIYTLKHIKNEDIYIKAFDDGSYEIKKCNAEELSALYRFLHYGVISDLDLYFYHGDRIAKFMETKEYEVE